VVRLASGTISVDLLEAEAEAEAEPRDWEQAVARLARCAGLILVRVDEPAEAELAVSPSLDALRVLSGADDAAVVACYRKLKGLAAAAEDLGAALPAIALAMMGAERTKASDSHARIARAARAFLEAELAEPVIVERIGPTGATTIFRGPAELTPEQVVRALRASPSARDVSVAPRETRPEPRAEEPAACGPVGTGGSPSAAGPARRAWWISELVGGLRALESRCPGAERVELAADDEGRLHLVAARLADHPEVSSARAVRDLVATAAWARAHAALLRRAEPSLVGEGEPSLHLVTDRRDDARALLGTAVRVHLVALATPGPLGLIAVSLED
jgi:hypothetical protein